MVVEPISNALLYYEESPDMGRLVDRFQKPLDEAYLLKASIAYPDAPSLLVVLEERTETTDWVKKMQTIEFLP